MQAPNNPAQWLVTLAKEMQWPVVVAASFWLGRHVHDLECRLQKAEDSLSSIVDRHMPAIHKALAQILGMLAARK